MQPIGVFLISFAFTFFDPIPRIIMAQLLAKLAPTPAYKDTPEPKRSTLVSHNIVVSSHRTSVRLEPEMWDGLQEICRRERVTLHKICTDVSVQKQSETSLTAAIRVFVMRYFRSAATEEGHSRAGHGSGLTFSLGAPAETPAYDRRHSALLTKTSFY